MSHRIKKIFSTKSKKLVTFITGGDPNYKKSLKIIKKLKDYGADIIEIGMPFSDPMADGPIIQLSSLRAIKNKIDLNKIFLLCREFRKFDADTPLILMGYYNPIHHFGDKKFINECHGSGVDGLIIVDLQPDNDNYLSNLATKKNIEFIRLVTPTTNELRLKTILSNASGFLYYVTITGITGQHSAEITHLRESILKVKKLSTLPVVAGFGIKNATQAKEICAFSDGVVVGSSIVKIIEENLKNNKSLILPNISNFVINLKKGII